MKLYVFAFNRGRGSLIEYFLKYSSQVTCYSYFSGKGKVPSTANDDIAIRDHDTCIGQLYLCS